MFISIKALVFLVPTLQAPFQKGLGPGTLPGSSDRSLCPGSLTSADWSVTPSPRAALGRPVRLGPHRAELSWPSGLSCSRRGEGFGELGAKSGLKLASEIRLPKPLIVGAERDPYLHVQNTSELSQQKESLCLSPRRPGGDSTPVKANGIPGPGLLPQLFYIK